MQRMPSTKARSSAGASTSGWGQGADFSSSTACATVCPVSTPHVAATLLTRLIIPRVEHVCGVAGTGAVRRYGRHSRAMLVCPRQTADPRLIATDAAVMMYGSANASSGRVTCRVCRGIRTANNDGPVCFRRKLYNAIDYQNRNVH